MANQENLSANDSYFRLIVKSLFSTWLTTFYDFTFCVYAYTELEQCSSICESFATERYWTHSKWPNYFHNSQIFKADLTEAKMFRKTYTIVSKLKVSREFFGLVYNSWIDERKPSFLGRKMQDKLWKDKEGLKKSVTKKRKSEKSRNQKL